MLQLNGSNQPEEMGMFQRSGLHELLWLEDSRPGVSGFKLIMRPHKYVTGNDEIPSILASNLHLWTHGHKDKEVC